MAVTKGAKSIFNATGSWLLLMLLGIESTKTKKMTGIIYDMIVEKTGASKAAAYGNNSYQGIVDADHLHKASPGSENVYQFGLISSEILSNLGTALVDVPGKERVQGTMIQGTSNKTRNLAWNTLNVGQHPTTIDMSFHDESKLKGALINSSTEAVINSSTKSRVSGLVMAHPVATGVILALNQRPSSIVGLQKQPFGEVDDLISTVADFLRHIFKEIVVFECHSSAYMFFIFLILWTCLSMPTTPVELCAGFIYGIGIGSIACMMGKTFGAVFSFLIGRQVGAKYRWTVPRALESHMEALHEEPFCTMVMIRMLPIPAGLKNYGLALCGPAVDLFSFTLSAFIVNCPFSILWNSLGSKCASITDALDFDATLGVSFAPLRLALPGLLVFLIAMIFVWQHREFLLILRKHGGDQSHLDKQSSVASSRDAQ